MATPDADVLIVGGGPAGLSAAVELRRLGIPRVVVLDREAALGGVPQHCHHLGFGLGDLHRVLSGPSYARRLAERAVRSGVECLTGTTAVGWTGPQALRITSRRGVSQVSARAIVLATGCRERSRAARLVPGSRPLGIYTTGSLQQLVHRKHILPGRRAVVVGAEHVSFSALLTLRAASVEIVAMLTEHPQQQSYGVLRMAMASRLGVPILCETQVASIVGERRVRGVETATSAGERREIACDTVVFTGDWVPEGELARLGGLAIDAGTRGPAIDAALYTSRRGVFAAGNLNHPAETADVAARAGRQVAESIHRFLGDDAWPDARTVTISTEPPLGWVFPNLVGFIGTRPSLHANSSRSATLRTTRFLGDIRLQAWQGDHLLHAEARRRLIPNRSIALDATWLARVSPDHGPVVISSCR